MQLGTLSEALNATLNKLSSEVLNHRALVGLDGFIDKIQKPVQSEEKDGVTYFESLDDFGQRIKEASEQSAQIELHTETIKLGGNAPIFSNALAHLSIRNTCIGTFGAPEIHPVFRKIHEGSELITLGDAAETNALEFIDGKLILSELSTFRDLNWAKVKDQVDLDYLVKQASKVELIGLVDWCNLPHASDIWLGFYEDVVKSSVQQKPHFFFDLADPSKKNSDEVKKVIEIINGFSDFGEVTLGLNQNETIRLAEFLGISTKIEDDFESMRFLGRNLFNLMSIDRLLIHPIDGCFSIDRDTTIYLEGRVVSAPKVSTGGGDNFNAGFCFGILNGLTDQEAMVCAMAASGAYVQNGKSADLEDMIHYMRLWQSEVDAPDQT